MKSLILNTDYLSITEDCYVCDFGEVDNAFISVASGVDLHYFFLSFSGEKSNTNIRNIRIAQGSSVFGSAVLMGNSSLEITTEIVGDNARTTLDLLALVQDNDRLSVSGIARVESPYRQISMRVDQTNILLGNGGKVNGIPRLEVATDDIEGGHSCRVHRLGGEALFYLTARGLSRENAETLLLNSEILKHLCTLHPDLREEVCSLIHKRLKKEEK